MGLDREGYLRNLRELEALHQVVLGSNALAASALDTVLLKHDCRRRAVDVSLALKSQACPSRPTP